MFIAHGALALLSVMALIVGWIVFGIKFWHLFNVAHRMRYSDQIFCKYVKASLAIGFVFGLLAFVPALLVKYLLSCL